ncbi:MAG TPA: Hsp20 family protein [Xanthobacteraceae bacterium]
MPSGVDAANIAANLKQGALAATLPNRPATRKPEKKIGVKAAA